MSKLRSLKRAGEEWQQVAWTELLIPDTPNMFGDIWTREAIIEARDKFMMSDFGIDLEHDNDDQRNVEYAVVEMFVARDDDPDFIPGSLVVGMKFLTEDSWNKVLSGEINGLSYEGTVYQIDVDIEWPDLPRLVSGVTEPDPFDGHTHTFVVELGEENKVLSGSTGETDGHSHSLTTHTITGKAAGHTHRYQILGD